MFGRSVKLFKLLGFTVSIDISWLIIAALIVWSLAAGLFPRYYPGLTREAYWYMGIAGALGLFFSIVFHEFCHSIVARRYGLPIKGITLFIFGGVSEMEDEPGNAKTEFLMAVAGPLSSFFISGVLYLVFFGSRDFWPLPVAAVILYLASINGLLGLFNLLPAFPLDGGRVLRSILWAAKGNMRWATRIAAGIGSGFGLGLIFLGIVSFFSGNLVGGIWWFLIGMFLRNASQMSYRQLMIKRALEGEHVERFMKRGPVTVGPSTTIADLVSNYIYNYHYKMFPVVDNGRLLGVVTLPQIKEIPKEEWDRRTVAEFAGRCTEGNLITPKDDATKALEKMSRTGNSRLMVVDEGRLVGILALKDLLQFLSLKMDFGQAET